LVTDGLPGIALAIEPGERGIMKRSPTNPKAGIFSRGLGTQIIWIGILMGLVSLIVGYDFWRDNENGPWQTMVFTTLVLSQMGNALALRSNYDSIFRIGLFSNKTMILAVLLTFVLQLLLIYFPPFQRVFNTQSLSILELLICLAASGVVFVILEFVKFFRRQRISKNAI
jgi:Ca2+-transporting ATPase